MGYARCNYRQVALWVVAVVTGFVMATAAYAQPAEHPMPHTILTHGTGEVLVSPDSVKVSLNITSTAKTLEKASSENTAKMTRMQQALLAKDFPNFKFKTQGFYSHPIHNSRLYRSEKIDGYRVDHRLEARIEQVAPEQLDSLGEALLATVLHHQADNVNQLEFYLYDVKSAQQQAVTKAFAEAKLQAETLAKAAGVVLAGPVTIEGMRHFPSMMSGFQREMVESAADEMKNAPPPLEIGKRPLRAEVHVRFGFKETN